MKKNIAAGVSRIFGLGLNGFTGFELERIHLATLNVLRDIGVVVSSKEALEVFSESGAKVDHETNQVYIPVHLVENAIESAPRSILLAGRNPKHDIVLEQRRVFFTNYGAGSGVIDWETGARRAATKQDVAYSALIADALDNVDIYCSAVTAVDTPADEAQLHEAEAFLLNTSKHCHHIHLTSGKGAKKFIEMGSIISGGMQQLRQRPIISAEVCPTSPLQLHAGMTDILMEMAKEEIPVCVLSMALAGATSPVTLAGTLVISNAEILAGIVLHQLINRGAPVIYGSSSTMFDLNNITLSVGSPELGLISAAICNLANYYGIPSFVAGTLADSKISDIQAGHEKSITAVLPALAGANIIFGMGMLDFATTFSFSQFVMDNEIVGDIKRVLNGIPIHDEDIGDLVRGITHQQVCRDKTKPAKAADRSSFYQWAEKRVTSILKHHKPEPLPIEKQNRIRSIVRNMDE